MRFKNWEPKEGEKALVPGGPGNASYVDALTADDVAAIQAGHRGYAPLRFYVVSKIARGYTLPDDVLELVMYDSGSWQVSHAFRRWNRLDACLADIRRYHGLKRNDYELRADVCR